jgi:hypothetical protein
MDLCTHCREIPSTFFLGQLKRYVHVSSFATLQSSADDGCKLCKILLWGIHERIAEIEGEVVTLEFEEIILSTKSAFRYGPAAQIIMSITNPAEIDEEFCTLADFVVTKISDVIDIDGRATEDDLNAAEQPGHEALKVAKTAESNEVLRLIRAWIENCLSNHPLCERLSTHTPTRLIDVGFSDDTSSLRLIVNADTRGGEVTYLALSHCWGDVSGEDVQQMITTSTNLSQRLIGFSLQSLPQSFRDAVYVTRHLGIRFLWIDSLCIIQDSDHDWQRESSMMGLIYQNALCTITANEARNSHGGIFHSRELPPLGLTLRPSVEDNAQKGQRVRVQITPFLPTWQTIVKRSPLALRGWTLQESQLSRRLIHFTKYEVCWECGFSIASERSPASAFGPPAEQFRVPGVNSFDQSTGPVRHRQAAGMINAWAALTPAQERSVRREMGDVNPPSPYQGWYGLVSEFSGRALTNAMDALPALAGISTDLTGRINDQYAAGLWKNDLLFGLSWTTISSLAGRRLWRIPGVSEKAKSSCSRPTVWRAPSWSWASIAGRVIFPFEFANPSGPSLEVLEVSSTPVSSINPMGAITEAFLRVRGLVMSGCMGKLDGMGRLYSPQGRSIVMYDTEEDEVKYSDSLMACLFVDSCFWEGPICLALVATGVRPDEYRRIGWMIAPRDPIFERKVITIV